MPPRGIAEDVLEGLLAFREEQEGVTHCNAVGKLVPAEWIGDEIAEGPGCSDAEASAWRCAMRRERRSRHLPFRARRRRRRAAG